MQLMLTLSSYLTNGQTSALYVTQYTLGFDNIARSIAVEPLRKNA